MLYSPIVFIVALEKNLNAFLSAIETNEVLILTKLQKDEAKISEFLKDKTIIEETTREYDDQHKTARKKIKMIITTIKEKVQKGQVEVFDAFWEALIETDTEETRSVMQMLSEHSNDHKMPDNNNIDEKLFR